MLLASTARIRKFRLRLLARIGIVDASDVMLWVDKVMEHKVQELYLDIPFYSLPHRFFSSNSLTELKLTMDDELMVPDSVCFPRLKILHLSLVKFSSVQSTEKLFSSCPVLEDLVLNFCNWERIDSIVLHFPSLRTLSFDHPEYLPASKIKISAPNLLSFKCRHQVAIDLDLCSLSSLEDASIGIDFGFIDPASSVQQAVKLKLIHGIRGAKSLTLLLNNTLEALLFEKDLQASLPTFDNLKHLGVGCAGDKSILRALMEVLRKAPNLHSLRVDGADNAFTEEEGILNTVPRCFKTSLKRFEFARFGGKIEEVRLLKYLLENATLIENMSLISSRRVSRRLSKEGLRRLKETINELKLSLGAATNCVLIYLNCVFLCNFCFRLFYHRIIYLMSKRMLV